MTPKGRWNDTKEGDGMTPKGRWNDTKKGLEYHQKFCPVEKLGVFDSKSLKYKGFRIEKELKRPQKIDVVAQNLIIYFASYIYSRALLK